MNNNSKLCNIIKEDKNWRETLQSLKIKVKEEYPLAIFNYDIEADFTNPIVREARGIIINLETLEVVCWPFTKFCNFHEEGAKIDLENFDWANCSCQDKVDGSIVKLWYNNIKGEWQWSTNSCIDAESADIFSFNNSNYLQLIKSADNYKKIIFNKLEKNYTYIFELVGPDNQLVVKYDSEHLYHLGTRNVISGEELNIDIGIEKPITYDLHSLDDCIEASKKLNPSEREVVKEGFVVVDKNWHRIKVKSPEYIAMHRAANIGKLSKVKIITILRQGMLSADELAKEFPIYSVYYKYYDFKLTELEWTLNRYIRYAKNMYDEVNRDRKAFALSIKKDKYARFGFIAVDCPDRTAKDMLNELSDNAIAKLIGEYEPEKLVK